MSFSNLFHQPVQHCSNFGDPCSHDAECLQSCPFGEVSAARMACVGSAYDKERAKGKCQAIWAEEGDPCVIGYSPAFDTCIPGEYGQNNLYCELSLGVDAWPNHAPSFNLSDVGRGYCKRRVQVPTRPQPVLCTEKYLDALHASNLLRCSSQWDAEQKAYNMCVNTASAVCDPASGQIKIGLNDNYSAYIRS